MSESLKKIEKYRKFEIVLTKKDDFNDNEVKQFEKKVDDVLNKVKNEYKLGYIKEYAYAIHDKDVYIDDEILRIPDGKKVGDLKSWHIHIGFSVLHACSFKTIANKFNVPENFVEKIKAGRMSSYLLYLTHKNRPKKYQYDDDIVVTTIEDWKFKRDLKELDDYDKESKEKKNMILAFVRDGVLTRYDFVNADSKNNPILMFAWANYREKIEDFLKANVESQSKKRNKDKDPEKKIVYVCGPSGYGKTTAAKKMAERFYHSEKEVEKNLFIGGSKRDIFQGYSGEKFVILDDVREDHFEFDEWLKLLDVGGNFDASSRYYNKRVVADVIALTCFKKFDLFCEELKNNNQKEDIFQFKRRVSDVYEIEKKEKRGNAVFGVGKHYKFNKESGKHEFVDEFEIELSSNDGFEIKIEDKTEENRIRREFLGIK